jgi:dephospho-CoA kinase
VVDESVRAVRLLEREKSNPTNYQLLEVNSTEQQVKGCLEDMADLVVDSTYSIEEVTKEVTSWLQSQCAKT